MGRIYTLNKALTNPSTTNIAIELKGNGSKAYILHRLLITTDQTTSAVAEVKVQRLSAAGSAGTAFAATDFGLISAGDAAISLSFSTTATAYTLGSAGTTTGPAVLDRKFNVVTGLDHYPTPRNQIELAADGLIGIYFPVAPAAIYAIELTLEEIG